MNPVLVWLSLAAAVVADEALLKSVPTVDLSAPTEESVATMQSALKQWGFFYVKNHGVSASLVQEQFGAAQAVFALPTQDKTRYNDNSGNSTDWGSLTVLVTDDVPGLEIETEEGWLPVPPRPDCFIVNAGDQVDFWTRGFFKSANHRVRPSEPGKPRYSTALFAYFDYEALVTPLEEIQGEDLSKRATKEPVTTGDYFALKLCESIGKPPEDCRVPSGLSTMHDASEL